MDQAWMILHRFLRVDLAQAAAHVRAEAQLEQRLTEVDKEEEAAEASEAAQAGSAAAKPADFTVSVKTPPLLTFVTAGISHPTPENPDKSPIILASGPFCLLAEFSAVPPTDPTKVYYFRPPRSSHLVVLRHFRRYGADGRIAASAERVPDRGGDIPELLFKDVERLGLLCDEEDRSYVIAELRITWDDTDSTALRHQALLVCYRSVLGAWSRNPMDVPLPPPPEKDGVRIRNRPWVPHGAVALDTMVIWFDLSWGLLSLDFNLNLQKSEFRLEFSRLPPDRELGPDESMADIHSKRCITVSGNLVRYVEIIDDPNGKAPTVSMWHRQPGAQGWEWTLNYKVSWEDIWNDDSYDEAGLPRQQGVPMLVCVNPLDPNMVYFSLKKKNVIFGVNVPEHRVVNSEPIGTEMAIPNSRSFLTWNIHPRTAEPHVSLDLPDDGYANKKHGEKDEEPPHDRKGKSKTMDGQRSTPASSGRNKTLWIK